MRLPQGIEVFVVEASYREMDGYSEPDVLGVFDNEEEAKGLKELIDRCSPNKEVFVYSTQYWGS